MSLSRDKYRVLYFGHSDRSKYVIAQLIKTLLVPLYFTVLFWRYRWICISKRNIWKGGYNHEIENRKCKEHARCDNNQHTALLVAFKWYFLIAKLFRCCGYLGVGVIGGFKYFLRSNSFRNDCILLVDNTHNEYQKYCWIE